MIGGGITVNVPPLCPLPFGLVTLMAPLTAPTGTVTVILMLESTVNCGALMPWKLTAVAPVKLKPAMVTLPPTGADAGVKPVMTGADEMVKFAALMASPAGVDMLIRPVVAPAGALMGASPPRTPLHTHSRDSPPKRRRGKSRSVRVARSLLARLIRGASPPRTPLHTHSRDSPPEGSAEASRAPFVWLARFSCSFIRGASPPRTPLAHSLARLASKRTPRQVALRSCGSLAPLARF